MDGYLLHPESIPKGVGGSVEDLLGWFPEVPLVASLNGERRLKLRRGVVEEPGSSSGSRWRDLRTLAFLFRLVLFTELVAPALGLEFLGVFSGLALFLCLYLLLNWVENRVGLRPWLNPAGFALLEVSLILPICYFWWPSGAMISWPLNLLAVFAVFALIWMADFRGAWAMPWGESTGLTRRKSRKLLRSLEASESGPWLDIVPETRPEFFPTPPPGRIEQFSKELALVLDLHEDIDSGAPIESQKLLTLAAVFGRSFPRGKQFYNLFDQAQAGEISQEDLRAQVSNLLAAPEELVAPVSREF